MARLFRRRRAAGRTLVGLRFKPGVFFEPLSERLYRMSSLARAPTRAANGVSYILNSTGLCPAFISLSRPSSCAAADTDSIRGQEE